MSNALATWLSGIPHEWATVLIAMTPIGELRLSIPIALSTYGLSIVASYWLSIAGNLLAVAIVLALLEPVSKWLRRFSVFDRFFHWLFTRTRRSYTKRFEHWGALALITFVAIPLPITGGWTGAVAAFVFGIPLKRALPLIGLGLLIAGIVVTLISQGAIRLFS